MHAPQLCLRPGIGVRTAPDGTCEVVSPGGVRRFGALDPVLARALQRLDGGQADIRAVEDDLLDDPDLASSSSRIAQLSRLIGALDQVLDRHLIIEGERLLVASRMTGGAPAEPARLPGNAWVRASRLALMRAADGETVLESPRSTWRVVIADPRVATLVAGLARPRRLAAVKAEPGPLSPEQRAGVLELLAGYDLIAADTASPAGPPRFAEDTGTLGQWSYLDLMMHARSRLGRHHYPYGGTFRYLGKTEPPAALRPEHSGRVVLLYRPAAMAIGDAEPSFSEVLEARQSIRSYGEQGLGLDQLGEFLFRATRTRACYGPSPDRGMPYQAADRPYPSGGGMYDLEVYVTPGRVRGLDTAVYHYDSWRHVLVEVCADADVAARLLETALLAKGGGSRPDAVLTVTSRFSRLSWKYEQIAYATTLRNVGVLYQTFYLVATAMGLAPCALGGGDSELAAAATGTDPFVEGSVGDFALGSLPASAQLHAERERSVLSDSTWRPGLAPEWCQVRSHVISGYRAGR